MSTPPGYASFLVRLWHKDSANSSEATADWRGEVEHIQSGQRWTFGTLDETLSFLHRRANDLEESDLPEDE